MERIRDFFSDHPKVRIGLIIGAVLFLMIYIAYKMDESDQSSRLERQQERRNNQAQEVSFFGARNTVETLDAERAQDLVTTLNRRMAEKESELDAREERQRHEVEQLRQELTDIVEQMATIRSSTSPNMGREQGAVMERISPATQQGVPEREYALEGDDRRLVGQNQQYRRQQNEIITEQPQRVGRAIRTITQRSIREVTYAGEINEQALPESRIISERTLQAQKDEEKIADRQRLQREEEQEFTLAMGSIISGTTLNGVAAPTAVGRSDMPIPVLMRIKHEAIMPNHFTLDIRECHIIGSTIGDLASSRVYIRAEGISCITNDGKAIERNITAYAVSSRDGMAGIEGEVVTRSSEMLANTMQAGFLSGFAQAATPQRVQPINTEPTTQTLYQTQNLNRMMGSGMLTGASNTLDRVADYYMSMADAMWPVVEVLPGVQIDFIVQRGMTMKLGTGDNRGDIYYD